MCDVKYNIIYIYIIYIYTRTGIPDVMVIVDGGTDVDVDGTYDVMSGSSFNITCMLTCPTATLMWIRNDSVITTSPSTIVTTDDFSVQYITNSDGEIIGSVLIRHMSQLNDTAMYQCATTVQTIQSNDTTSIFVYGKWNRFVNIITCTYVYTHVAYITSLFALCMECCGDTSCLRIPIDREESNVRRTKESPWHSKKIVFRTTVS